MKPHRSRPDRHDRRRHRWQFTPPGQLIDVGGHRLHVIRRGSGSPAVLLESGPAPRLAVDELWPCRSSMCLLLLRLEESNVPGFIVWNVHLRASSSALLSSRSWRSARSPKQQPQCQPFADERHKQRTDRRVRIVCLTQPGMFPRGGMHSATGERSNAHGANHRGQHPDERVVRASCRYDSTRGSLPVI